MALSCLTAGRMTMSATLLHRNNVTDDPYPPFPPSGDGSDIDLDDYGTWEDSQDPLTGEIVKLWQPYPDPNAYPSFDYTPPGSGGLGQNLVTIKQNVPCIARGIVDGGIRVAGTTERFGAEYENVDYVKMWVPPSVIVTKRDRITNIKDRSGRVRWLDEEYYDPTDPESTLRATVFNVNGVTPLFDAFNNIVEWYIMLERVQS